MYLPGSTYWYSFQSQSLEGMDLTSKHMKTLLSDKNSILYRLIQPTFSKQPEIIGGTVHIQEIQYLPDLD